MLKVSKRVVEVVETVLNKYPTENHFGVEAFNFNFSDLPEYKWEEELGYIYPCKGGYGNAATYKGRKWLEALVAFNQ